MRTGNWTGVAMNTTLGSTYTVMVEAPYLYVGGYSSTDERFRRLPLTLLHDPEAAFESISGGQAGDQPHLLDGSVYDMCVMDGVVYLGGAFDDVTAGGDVLTSPVMVAYDIANETFAEVHATLAGTAFDLLCDPVDGAVWAAGTIADYASGAIGLAKHVPASRTTTVEAALLSSVFKIDLVAPVPGIFAGACGASTGGGTQLSQVVAGSVNAFQISARTLLGDPVDDAGNSRVSALFVGDPAELATFDAVFVPVSAAGPHFAVNYLATVAGLLPLLSLLLLFVWGG